MTCQEILEEFEEKLQGKFAYSSELAQAKVQEILHYSQLVTITNTLDSGITDPNDNMILECAVVGGATHIVTGDKRHLLPLGSYQGISIYQCSRFPYVGFSCMISYWLLMQKCDRSGNFRTSGFVVSRTIPRHD